jgi:hypothetical protein
LGNVGRGVAVGGGVVGDQSYAVGATYPVVDAQGRPTGWAGELTELPRVQLLSPELGGIRTEIALIGTPWAHRQSLSLPAGLLRSLTPKGYSKVSMYVVCARLVPPQPDIAPGYRLETTVSRAVVPAQGRVARISCPKGAVAVGGGVVGDQLYAVGATYPVVDAQGRPTGWAGALTELPRLQLLPPELGARRRTAHSLSSYWRHRHEFSLPAGLIRSLTLKGYSKVSMYVVCARLVSPPQLLTVGYRLVTTVSPAVVPAQGRVARISCPKGAVAVGGGVVGDQLYAVGATYPVVDARGRPTGWAGALTELPRLQLLPPELGEGISSARALIGTAWDHRHRFSVPAGLLRSQTPQGYSEVSMYVVCTRLVPPPEPRVPKVLQSVGAGRSIGTVRGR